MANIWIHRIDCHRPIQLKVRHRMVAHRLHLVNRVAPLQMVSLKMDSWNDILAPIRCAHWIRSVRIVRLKIKIARKPAGYEHRSKRPSRVIQSCQRAVIGMWAPPQHSNKYLRAIRLVWMQAVNWVLHCHRYRPPNVHRIEWCPLLRMPNQSMPSKRKISW